MTSQFPRTSRPVTRQSGERFILAGTEVREDDVEPATGLHIAGIAFRISAAIILLLAIWQAYDWFRDRPPGGAGLSVIIGDTIRLAVTSFLLYGAADLADLFVKNFQEIRATRILMARQTYLMKQMGVFRGEIPTTPREVDRRGLGPEEAVSLNGE